MLGRDEIAARIPHAGRMCLLDRVLEWDERHIRCAAESHRDPDNPLREGGGLPVWAGIEYAAQAAAVHGSLLAGRGPRAGMLGKVSGVRPACEWLDRAPAPLVVDATLLHGDPAGAVYSFEARSGGALLLEGRLTLAFPGGGPAVR